MFKEIDFIIYIEHRVRELDSALLIYKALSDKGFTGKIVPLHYNLRLNLLQHKPKIVILPQCYSEINNIFNLYEQLYGDSFERLNLHQEQITDTNGIEFMMPTDDYSKNTYHISWGIDFAKMLKTYGVNQNKILITGSPRIDLITNIPNNDFRNKVANEFKINSNKKWILVPMNFSLTDVDEKYLREIEQSGYRNIREKVAMTTKSMKAFFDIFTRSFESLTDYVFIFRPHPHENPQRYHFLLKGPNTTNDIFVIRKYSVGDWIKASHKVINWTSTTALEAILLKKPVANLQPIKLGQDFEMEYFKYIPRLTNCDELITFIKTDTINNCNPELDEYLKRTFYKLDGCSSKRVGYAIQFILQNSEIDFNKYHLNKLTLMKLIIQAAMIDLSKLILYKLKLLDKVFKKFEGIKEDYITDKDIYRVDGIEEFSCEMELVKKSYGIEF